MSPAVNGEGCAICGTVPHVSERRVLVVGRARRSYCSEACLRVGVRMVQLARRKTRLRRYAVLLAFALVAAGAGYLRQVLLEARSRVVPIAAPAPVAPPAPPEPTPFGPSWPPTDDEWQEQFTRAAWVYPLPGPTRRPPASSSQLFTTGPAPSQPPRCRPAGRCGVDLGGELWGEHIYAAHDGVIDRLQRNPEEGPGGISVRIAHWNGAVFTRYFHLAAIPHLAVGMHVNAGDVIGLAGDTGLPKPRPHLHFALSVQPSRNLPEIYWDPQPLMAEWPLETPARGSVAGLVSIDAHPERVAGRLGDGIK
jgi:murein DD-endopeptidase MepM/ murein hydrolase activator NlpD